MQGPVPYILFPGTAREALEFYRETFGGELQLFTYEQFNRTDGPGDAIAHGTLDGEVTLHGADAKPDEDAVATTGLMLSLLTTDAEQQRARWSALCDGGRVIDDLQQRPWGDFDGQVRDRFGLHWLIGFPG